MNSNRSFSSPQTISKELDKTPNERLTGGRGSQRWTNKRQKGTDWHRQVHDDGCLHRSDEQ